MAAHGRRFRVELEEDGIVSCVTRGRKSDIACGDHVHVAHTGAAEAVIESLEPRRNLFFRSDLRREKLIAANVTQVVVVVASRPAWSPQLVDRCLIGAEHAGAKALIVLNKVDLPETPAAQAGLSLYRTLGYRVCPLSARDDIEPLRSLLLGETSVLVGQSGMGKSTMINALLPDASARVGEISEALGTGRHTTTHAELYHLDESSHIIDSPGLQEFGLSHLDRDELAHAFVEFRPFLGHCRFRDCAHLSEPGCAVTAAAAGGEIAEPRLASYRRFARELMRTS